MPYPDPLEDTHNSMKCISPKTHYVAIDDKGPVPNGTVQMHLRSCGLTIATA